MNSKSISAYCGVVAIEILDVTSTKCCELGWVVSMCSRKGEDAYDAD